MAYLLEFHQHLGSLPCFQLLNCMKRQLKNTHSSLLPQLFPSGSQSSMEECLVLPVAERQQISKEGACKKIRNSKNLRSKEISGSDGRCPPGQAAVCTEGWITHTVLLLSCGGSPAPVPSARTSDRNSLGPEQRGCIRHTQHVLASVSH